jgi:hypothetical protein
MSKALGPRVEKLEAIVGDLVMAMEKLVEALPGQPEKRVGVQDWINGWRERIKEGR